MLNSSSKLASLVLYRTFNSSGPQLGLRLEKGNSCYFRLQVIDSNNELQNLHIHATILFLGQFRPVVLNLFMSAGHMMTWSGLAGRKSLNYRKPPDKLLPSFYIWFNGSIIRAVLSPITLLVVAYTHTYMYRHTYHSEYSFLLIYTVCIYFLLYVGCIYFLFLLFEILGCHHWKVIYGPHIACWRATCGPRAAGWESLVYQNHTSLIGQKQSYWYWHSYK